MNGFLIQDHVILMIDYLNLPVKKKNNYYFNILEKNGYKYHEKTNTLEKIVLPIFKVGG